MPRAYQWTSPFAAGTLVPGGPKKCSVYQHVLLTMGVDWPLEKGGWPPGAAGREAVGEASHVGAGRGSHRGLILSGSHSKAVPSLPLTHTRSHLLPPDPTSPNLVSLSACLPRLTLSA